MPQNIAKLVVSSDSKLVSKPVFIVREMRINRFQKSAGRVYKLEESVEVDEKKKKKRKM